MYSCLNIYVISLLMSRNVGVPSISIERIPKTIFRMTPKYLQKEAHRWEEKVMWQRTIMAELNEMSLSGQNTRHGLDEEYDDGFMSQLKQNWKS